MGAHPRWKNFESPTLYTGPEFHGPCAAIANSHQPLYPESGHPWVEAIRRAVDFLAESNATLFGSVGLSSYELPLWYAGKSGLKQIVVIPVRDFGETGRIEKKVLEDFELDTNRTAFLFFESKSDSKKSQERDRLVLLSADSILPVSVNGKGRIQHLLAEFPDKTDIRFSIPYKKHKPKIKIPDAINPDLVISDWPFLTHWTRRFNGPAPNESRAAYYRSVLSGNGGYSRSAFYSLKHILESKRIFASSAGIRGGYSATSFTSLPPSDAVRLMKWNSARVRFVFEPYGVAIKRSALKRLGARPAIYGKSCVYDGLREPDRPFYQFSGRNRKWMAEREWRLPGDARLSEIGSDNILVLTATRREKNILAGEFPDYGIASLSMSD